MDVLDAEELYHLAIKAGQENDSDKAIRYYKQSLEKDPQPQTYYLLAAEYADLGMYGRAVEYMNSAVEMNPELYTAHLQLGLLHLVTQNTPAATEAFQPLLTLPDQSYLYKFGVGLIALIEEDLAAAKASLLAGIDSNQENPALNGDMRKIVGNIDAAAVGNISDENAAGDDAAEDATAADGASQFLLSNYQKSKQ